MSTTQAVTRSDPRSTCARHAPSLHPLRLSATIEDPDEEVPQERIRQVSRAFPLYSRSKTYLCSFTEQIIIINLFVHFLATAADEPTYFSTLAQGVACLAHPTLYSMLLAAVLLASLGASMLAA